MASLLIPSSPKGPLRNSFAVDLVWEAKPSVCCSLEKENPENPSKVNKKRALKSNKIATHYQKTRLLPRRLSSSESGSGVDESSGGGDDNRESGNDQAMRSVMGETHKNLQRQAYHPLPKYPWVCRKRHQEGMVSLKVKTNGEGHVIDVSLNKSCGYVRLDEAALEAVKSWIFAEGNSQKTLSIAFRLKG